MLQKNSFNPSGEVKATCLTVFIKFKTQQACLFRLTQHYKDLCADGLLINSEHVLHDLLLLAEFTALL